MSLVRILPRSFGTHDGEFHADEVTACALLLHFQLIDRDKITRTREERRLEACDFVCDVAGEYNPKKRRFDHHQVGYTGDLSSAGMVLSYLKEQKIISEAFYVYMNRVLIKGIDDIDNGRGQIGDGFCSFSNVISAFVPPNHELMADLDAAFYQALDFTLGHLSRIERKFSYVQTCKKEVSVVMNQMHACLLFDKAMPWLESFFELGGERHPAKFIIMPTGKHWKLRGIPPSYQNQMAVRVPLPEKWAGLLGKALIDVTGIEGAIFCHKGRFISVWKTKEDALRALKIILTEK